MSAEAESPQGRQVAHILLDSALPQLDHLFDYRVPEELASRLRVGQRVRVPFRSQSRHSYGYVIGFADRSDFGGELQPIAELVSDVAQLTPEIWRLARTLADRAGGSASDILRLAIPKRMVRAEKQHFASPRDVAESERVQTESIASESGLTSKLISGGRLAISPDHGPTRLGTGEWVGGWAAQLAEIAIAVWSAGRSAILIAPDYRDVDQLDDALVALGHTDAVRVDSRQTGSARYASFLRSLDAAPRIVLGNRSAVYAPAYRLGAILMWDDGDPLLAEPLAPYVHSRDAALVRAQLADDQPVGLVFAAHSRSAEVQRLIDIGYVEAEGRTPRRTRVIAAEAVQTNEARPGRIPEFAARAIREGLTAGPVLVQVATPGYAPVAVCQRCNSRAKCAVCAGPIGFLGAGRSACRWCGEHTGRWQCGTCSATRLIQRGAGSELTVEQFRRQFSDARVVLSDGAHPVERVDSRSALVVATRGAEPIAASGYAAVVLLDVEKLLSIESLRAAEDCLRWWQNAAAMARPSARVVVASGAGPVVQAFVTGRTEDWLRAELRDRQQLRYPPAVRVASVTGGAAEVQRALAKITGLPGVDVLGPTAVAAAGDATVKGEGALVRAIVRFDYSQGAEVARLLRGALVADAAGASSRVAGRVPGRARPEALRLRFDDRSVFDF